MSEGTGEESRVSTKAWIVITAACCLPLIFGGMHVMHDAGRREGLAEGFTTAANATGFVGCGKKGGPMMTDFKECAELKESLASHSGQGTYVVYTDAPTLAPPR